MDKKRGHRHQYQLDAAVATIQGRYGPWALVRGSTAATRDEPVVPPHVPTGFPHLDRILGIDGLPKGRVCEVIGPTTSGKTTLALTFLAQAQRDGGQVGYIDQSLCFDPDYAHRCGLSLSRLLVGMTPDLLEALSMLEALVRSGSLSALVFDAMGGLWTDPQAASKLEATLSRLPTPLTRNGTILLILHESSTSRSPALSALAHCAAVRLLVTREQWIQQYDDVWGYKVRVEVLKSRVGPAGRSATIDISFNGAEWGDGLGAHHRGLE